MVNIASRHDKFVQMMLSDQRFAIDYFKSALPAHIAGKLDFSTMKLRASSYVSKQLERSISDLVYTCDRTDVKGDMDISLLLEHKSYRDRFTPVQIGGYLFSAYQQQINQGRRQLSPIIPILLYHGKEKWEYRTLDGLFDKLDAELLGYIPKYDYIYHNLANLSEGALSMVSNQFLASFLLSLKLAWDKERLKAQLPEILSIGFAEGNELQQTALLFYNFAAVDFTEEQLKEILDGLPSDLKNKFMTTYDMLIEKGRQEVMKKAERLIKEVEAKAEQERAKAEQVAYAEKLQSALAFKRMGVPVTDIAKALQLPLEVVEKLA